MMKKRLLALLLCALMLLSGLPVLPFSFGTEITAAAADVTELKSLVDSIPERSKWNLYYVDSTALAVAYDNATELLKAPDAHQDSEVRTVTAQLKSVLNTIQYHTIGLAVDPREQTAPVGGSVQLKATKEPSNAADTVTWMSGNAAAAEVNNSGKVTVKKYSADPVLISAVSNGISSSCTLHITNPIARVKLSETNTSILTGKELKLEVEAVGADEDADPTDTIAAGSTFWRSDNTAVASVSNYGTVKGLSAGVATITVSVTSAGKQFTADCVVTVGRMVEISSIESVSVPVGGTLTTSLGATETVSVKVEPANASDKKLTWTSSDPSVATVGESTVDGAQVSTKVNALKEGTARITYSANDGSGLSGYFTVNVNPAVSFIQVSPEKIVVAPNAKNQKVSAKVLPEDAGNQVVTWKSSNENVCQVNYAGELNPKMIGTCTITATTTDGSGLSGDCFVRVADPASAVSVDKDTLTLNVGDTAVLKGTVRTTSGTTYNDVEWVSSNASVVTVDSSGRVEAVGPGTASVLAVALDGTEKNAVCAVSVSADLQKIELDKDVNVDLNGTITLSPTFVPAYASNKTVSWSSSNTGVATVSSKGVVSGKKAGTAVITCTGAGGVKATCNVHVVNPATGITLSEKTLTLAAGSTQKLSAKVTPDNATDKTVSWSSSDDKVATVSASGEVTAVAGGKCTITATTKDGGYSDSVTITVTKMVAVTGIYIADNNISMLAGNTYAISAQIFPSNASNKNIIWESSDTSVAAVFNGGEVSANGPGTCTITATTVDGGYSYRCTVKVTQGVTGIKLSKTKLNVPVSSSKTLTASVVPANATNKKFSWHCADTSIATVSNKGIVTGKKPGTTTVTVMTEEGSFSASCTVVVYTPANGIKINSDKITLGKGAKTVLTATVTPADVSNKGVEWSSSDASVASVNATGQVSGLKVGSAVITAKTADGKYKDTCLVEVLQLATEVVLDFTNLQLDVGKSKTLSASLRPITITNKNVKWSSSDKTIASVNSKGTITALKAGTVTIKCASADGGAKATCRVTVIQRVTSIKFKNPTDTVKVGAKKYLAVTMLPKDASETTFIWKSSNKKIAKVNSKGKVLGVGPGTCTIKVSNAAGTVKAKCSLTVTTGVESFTLDKSSVTISKGRTTTLQAIITPKNATNKGVTWTSSNNDVATVNSKGKIKAKAVGYAVITAKSNDTGATATCKVRVVYGVTGVTLDQSKLTLAVGKKQTLKATITPANASNKNLIWRTSNKNIVKVNSTGLIKAIRPGTATITVTAEDGGFKASCKVTAIVPVTGVSLSRTKLSLEKGKVFKLKANIAPADATNKAVKWISGDPTVLKVDENGKVKAVGAGTAVITVKTKDGNFTAKCKITVRVFPTGVKLSNTKLNLGTGKTMTLKSKVLPADAPQTVTWSSSAPAVVSVSQTGLIRCKSVGSAVIKATTSNGKSATCVINVQEVITELALNKNALSLVIGQTSTLKASAKPANLSNGTLTWTSSNAKVATVNSKGIVTAVAPGTATITVSNAASGLSDTCTVSVRRAVKGVSLNQKTLNLNYRETALLEAMVTPRNATNQTIIWESSNMNVAKVTKKGLVTAIGSGTAIITAVTDDGGFAASCTVNVHVAVTGITLEASAKTVNVGNTITLTATTVPAVATNKTIEYSSSDISIARVNANGVVTGIKAGDVTLTAKTADGGYLKSVIISVVDAVTSIEFDQATIIMSPGAFMPLSPRVLPESAADKSLTWKSANPSIATVDSTGKVKAIAPGETTITAVSNNSGASNSITVRVAAADGSLTD